MGGGDLQGPGQRYTYFLVREGGEFLVKTRSGAGTAVVRDWTPHAAVMSFATKPEERATAKNVLALEADGDELRFFVNGEQVWACPRGTLSTDGVFGLRVNHGLNLHVTTIVSGRAEPTRRGTRIVKHARRPPSTPPNSPWTKSPRHSSGDASALAASLHPFAL